MSFYDEAINSSVNCEHWMNYVMLREQGVSQAVAVYVSGSDKINEEHYPLLNGASLSFVQALAVYNSTKTMIALELFGAGVKELDALSLLYGWDTDQERTELTIELSKVCTIEELKIICGAQRPLVVESKSLLMDPSTRRATVMLLKHDINPNVHADLVSHGLTTEQMIQLNTRVSLYKLRHVLANTSAAAVVKSFMSSLSLVLAFSPLKKLSAEMALQ